MTVIRLANERDIDRLIQLCWNFTLEDDEGGKIRDSSFEGFHEECNYLALSTQRSR